MNDDTTTATTSRKSLWFGLVGIALIGGGLLWGFLQEEPYGTAPANEETLIEDTAPAEERLPEPLVTEAIVPAQDDAPTISEESVEEESALLSTEDSRITQDTVSPEAPDEPEGVTLNNSDALIRELAPTFAQSSIVTRFAAQDQVTQRIVAIMDNLGQGAMPYKLLPVTAPKQAFSVIPQGDYFVPAETNSARYDALADFISSVDAAAVVSAYNRLQPALGEAYALLGYDSARLHTRLEDALSTILLTPAAPQDPLLIKREAVYIYADKSLESLPALQKQLLRMGDSNAQKVMDKAREIRSLLVETQ
jgi:hypothetical protein